MNRFLCFVCLMVLGFSGFSEDSKINVKINTGLLFSKPGHDLAAYAKKGNLRMFLEAETPVYSYEYSAEKQLGFTLAGALGSERYNFLSYTYLTEIDVNIFAVKGRIYPFTSNLGLNYIDEIFDDDFLFMFPIDLVLQFLVAISINSLHFDFGTGFGTLHEKSYIEEYEFTPETTTRMMFYSGWGIQPQIFESENGKLTANAVFDTGRYRWINKNKGTSSIKANYLGFGIQYRF